MATCRYCSSQAWEECPWGPVMCEKHFELSAVIARLKEMGRPVTFENINLMLALLQDARLSYRPAEVRILLNQMQVVS